MESKWTMFPEETHVVSVMTLRLAAKARIKDERGSSLSSARDSKAKTDGEKFKKNQAREEKVLQTKRSRICQRNTSLYHISLWCRVDTRLVTIDGRG